MFHVVVFRGTIFDEVDVNNVGDLGVVDLHGASSTTSTVGGGVASLHVVFYSAAVTKWT